MEKLNEILRKHCAESEDTKDKLLGASFIVVNKNGTLFEGSAGRIDIPTDSPPWTSGTFTWIASLTKLITVTCVMQLVEKGVVKLDDDMRPLVPHLAALQVLRGFDEHGMPILEDITKPITLRHLLTHTTGLAYDIIDPDLCKWSAATGRTATNVDSTLEGWATPAKFPPGEGWCYGPAVDWAGQALERLTGGTLGAYISEHVLAPLGMRDTTFRREGEGSSRWRDRTAVSTVRGDGDGRLAAAPPLYPADPPVEGAGAGLYSTAADYAAFLAALLAAGDEKGEGDDDGSKEGGGLLGQAAMDEMFRPQLDGPQREMLRRVTDEFRVMVAEFPAGTRLDHGLGGIVNLDDVPGKRRAGSMSWMGACNSHWWLDRKAGIGATLMLNVFPSATADPVVVALYDELERATYAALDSTA